MQIDFNERQQQANTKALETMKKELRALIDMDSFYKLGGQNMERMVQLEYVAEQNLQGHSDSLGCLVDLYHEVHDWMVVPEVRQDSALLTKLQALREVADNSPVVKVHRLMTEDKDNNYQALKAFNSAAFQLDFEETTSDLASMVEMARVGMEGDISLEQTNLDLFKALESVEKAIPLMKKTLLKSKTIAMEMEQSKKKEFEQSGPSL